MKKNIILVLVVMLVIMAGGFIVSDFFSKAVLEDKNVMSRQTAGPGLGTPPTVVTYDADVNRDEVVLNGEVTDGGGGGMLSKGFDYGLTVDYGSYAGASEAHVSPYSVEVPDLPCGKTYHFRATATNSDGLFGTTGQGEDKTFTTTRCPATGSSAQYRTQTTNPTVFSEPIPASPAEESSPAPSGPAPSPSEEEPPSCFLVTKLFYGSTGDEVKCLQTGLNTKILSNLVLDGMFGPLTKAAVIKFQLANNLVGDGIVGPLTRGVLNQ